MDFNKRELAISVLDDQEHSLAQKKREREEAELGVHDPSCSHVGVVNLAGGAVPPRTVALMASIPAGEGLNMLEKVAVRARECKKHFIS